MNLWLVEILVRTGLCVIADGRCRPRWYGGDQSKVCKLEQGMWWGSWAPRFAPFTYYLMRKRVTGSNWQWRQYIAAYVGGKA